MVCRKTEVHHRVPRHLLAAYDRMENHTEIDGEGIELALRFMHLALEYGVSDSVNREELVVLIESSCVELDREYHRRLHASDWRVWGQQGGRTTLSRYGKGWFVQLARRRWRKISARDLELVRTKLLSQEATPT
ncbi:hypothetical protein [Rubrobacter radiotolerans]|uniref:Uncharacterized protein n=1 Tax=Rubrobacter radiotolerans TaxID=42256 RepID=A0AB35TB29_RUBRA|nr:hypothetical protein [Rubrobacter radiotolerans]MDX5895171.1 hypothetical protein [Rubrobacter radiotolerans]SMC07589.1 conserved hypothetical protein [Rubrobacter radiotolerans DSM 5868]